jgi:hypothetical protein
MQTDKPHAARETGDRVGQLFFVAGLKFLRFSPFT